MNFCDGSSRCEQSSSPSTELQALPHLPNSGSCVSSSIFELCSVRRALTLYEGNAFFGFSLAPIMSPRVIFTRQFLGVTRPVQPTTQSRLAKTRAIGDTMAALSGQLFLTLHRAKQHYSGQTCLPSLSITVYSLRSQLLLYLLALPKFNYTRLTSCLKPPATEDMSHDMTSCASHK